MKVTAILFFAAALGSASPVGTRSHSMQARAGQCDCSKPFRAGNRFDDACPAGYKDISRNFFTISCVQAGCSEDEFEAQCNAGEPASAPPAVVEQPAQEEEEEEEEEETPATLPGGAQGAGQCDCSKPFRAGSRFDDACPAGYKDISRNFFTISCAQAGCSESDFEAQCGADQPRPAPAPAPPAVVAEQPTGKTPAAPPGAQSACDCSKSFFAKADPVDNTCPAAYKDISKSSFSVSCAQVGCSKGDFEAQCGVRP
ncbi:hypothetical protein ISF_06178 [Cordyceps fumosorosea ARSEF 2679]|uniref:Uncharacterized protein n=1 Tax=Cordyceps fumosorosea (strain ARSEF 2679) TaxID=1081104 RepID=A0A167T229_CORFA|nr:hypothetical protein ISF_06178 [Cordyceps fumosorosea ARSEF 2679]OAA60168.1 hypothetical protein ISF_06178 [Cordyceps fumosorosea ARSEF 2679]